MEVTDNFEKIFKGKQKILAIFAHPDDAELYAGGTLARLIEAGKDVRIVKVTSGDKRSRQEKISSQELKTIRLEEDRQSMNKLGISDENNIYLNIEDGSVENSPQVISGVARQIRIFHPDIIITHNPEDIIIRFDQGINWVNHRDHRNTGLSAIDAAYPYSRDTLFFPEQLKDGGSSHICTEFLLVDYYNHPDLVYIDVTEFIDKRIEAHSKHASQYSKQAAKDSADFFTTFKTTNKRYERFRHVVAD